MSCCCIIVLVYVHTIFSLTCSFVTSYPYSLSRTSGWHGYRVCDIRIIVSGPHKHLPEVQNTLGRLKNFTCTTYTDFDETYDADNESDNDGSTESNLFDDTVDHGETNTEHDEHTTETDCILIEQTQQDCILISSDSNATPPVEPPAFLQQQLRFRTRITVHKLPTSTITDKQQDSNADTDSSTEPLSDIDRTRLLTETATNTGMARRQQPRRLFTTTDK